MVQNHRNANIANVRKMWAISYTPYFIDKETEVQMAQQCSRVTEMSNNPSSNYQCRFPHTRVHPALIHLSNSLVVFRGCHTPDFALHSTGKAPSWEQVRWPRMGPSKVWLNLNAVFLPLELPWGLGVGRKSHSSHCRRALGTPATEHEPRCAVLRSLCEQLLVTGEPYPSLNPFPQKWGSGTISFHPKRAWVGLCHNLLELIHSASQWQLGINSSFLRLIHSRWKFLLCVICQMEKLWLLDESVTSAEILYSLFPPICEMQAQICLHVTNGHIILSNCRAAWKLGIEFCIILHVMPVTLRDYI